MGSAEVKRRPTKAGGASVVINGSVGVGKSTTLRALGDLLAQRRVPHALVDFDTLCSAWPAPVGDSFHLRLGLRNLTDVAANYRAAGMDRLAIASVLTNRAEVEAFSHATRADRMLVCGLRADPQTVEARLSQRHDQQAAWEMSWFVERFVAFQNELDAAAIDDMVINVDDRSPTAVAEEILAAASW